MSDETEIRRLLNSYQRALNDSDADAAADCYTRDGVFMPTTLPTITGTEMREGYERIFADIRLAVTFTVDELVVASTDLAYALTRSNGHQTVLASGVESNESNREVFIFGREDSAWKIRRYLFNKPK